MPTDAPPRRGPGRPRKPKPQPSPRNPPLPFQATRDRLAAQLGRGRKTKAAAPAPAKALADVATQGLVTIERAIIGPLGHPFRFDLTPEQLARAAEAHAKRAEHQIKGLAANSLRTRASDWLTWLAFCAHYDRVVLPASFDDLAQFIHELIGAQRQKATIEHILWSIGSVHTRHRLPDPMADPDAADFWRDRVREDLHDEQAQAQPLRKKLLKQLVSALDTTPARPRRVQPRLRARALAAQQRRRLRDVAMLHVAYDLLTRASELVSLEWCRLTRKRNGSGIYRFGKTKTDQSGKGTDQYLTRETMAALDRWQAVSPVGGYMFHPVSDDLELPLDAAVNDKERQAWAERAARGRAQELLPLTPRQVGTVFRRACAVAGVPLDETWLSGHSARVGAAQDMAAAGMSPVEMQIAGRWANGRMPAHYASQINAEQAGKRRHSMVDGLSAEVEADTGPAADDD